MELKVGVSNRHVHLNEEDLEILFGSGYELNVEFPLTQANMFGAKEHVNLKSGNKLIENVRIVGPIRNYTQIEVSQTDALYLGINPPLRDSGDLIGSSPITIVGPKGYVNKDYGCIRAARHIHVPSKDILNVQGNKVDLICGNIKITNVHIKEHKDYVLELHIDKDESNLYNIDNGEIKYFKIIERK